MSVRIKRIEFKSINQIDILHGVIYIPQDREIKGVVQVSHGMCEYIGRYHHFLNFLAENGYVACGHDHLGHGESVICPEDLGFFGDHSGWKYLVEDLYRFTRIVKDMFYDFPIYLLGHSMGSFIARIYAAKYPFVIDGLIISGTGGTNKAAAPAINLASATCRLKGCRYRSQTIDNLAFKSFNKGFENRTEKEWLSSDLAVQEAYIKDPKCMFLFTAAAFKDLFTLNTVANSRETFCCINKSLPILMFSGTKDPVGNFSKGVKEVYTNYQKAGVEDITLKLYEDGRHEMLKEVNKQEVYGDILKWLSDFD